MAEARRTIAETGRRMEEARERIQMIEEVWNRDDRD
jgi:hypothetical protein